MEKTVRTSTSACNLRLIVHIFIFMYINLRLRTEASDISSIKRLHETLFAKYNKLITPRSANGAPIIVRFGLRLQQLIDVDEVHQVVTLRTWVYQEWIDGKLRWDQKHFPNITHIQVPSAYVWRPDLVLHNNAEGRYSMENIKSLALVHHDGRVVWEPQAIFKFYCNIAIDQFPFDVQNCTLKFGPWSHNGLQIDLRHAFYAEDPIGERGQIIHRLQDSVRTYRSKFAAARERFRNAIRLGNVDTFGGLSRSRPRLASTGNMSLASSLNETFTLQRGKSRLSQLFVRWKRRAAAPLGGGGGPGEAYRESYFDPGIDLRDYTPSTQWDLIAVPAYRAERFYPCCPNEPYPELFFRIVIRRNAVTYLMYFIFPCVGMATLSLFVFYLPADSRQKVHFGVNVFLSLSLFNMAIIEIMPPTSGAVPLMGKVLIFTTMCIGLSVLSSIIVLNVQFTNNLTRQRLQPRSRDVFMRKVPKFLGARKPDLARLKNLQRLSQCPDPYANNLRSTFSSPSTRGSELFVERSNQQETDGLTNIAHSESNHQLIADYPELTLPLSALPQLREERQQSSSSESQTQSAVSARRRPRRALRRWLPDTSRDNIAFSPPTPQNRPPPPSVTAAAAVANRQKFVVFPRTAANQQCVKRMAQQMSEVQQTFGKRLHQQSIGFDWQFVAVMADRICQIILSIMFVSGLVYMILLSPHLYDTRPSLPLKCTWEQHQTSTLSYYACTKATSYSTLIALPSSTPSFQSTSEISTRAAEMFAAKMLG